MKEWWNVFLNMVSQLFITLNKCILVHLYASKHIKKITFIPIEGRWTKDSLDRKYLLSIVVGMHRYAVQQCELQGICYSFVGNLETRSTLWRKENNTVVHRWESFQINSSERSQKKGRGTVRVLPYRGSKRYLRMYIYYFIMNPTLNILHRTQWPQHS